MHVIIQAGGKGTRLESLTRNRPKCLVPVDNRPMIFWTFEAFKGADFSVICDYKADVLERYLAAFGSQYSVKIVSADGTGTISGIEQVVSQIRDDEPILIVWCDLFFEKDYRVPEALTERPLKANFVGLSGTFPCRWSFENGQFVHAASSSAGVAGFFVFKNKDELRDIPHEGALVPWLQGKGTTFAPLYLERVTEVGTLSAFEAIKKPDQNFAGACFTSGSAGTMSAGDLLKERYPHLKLAVGEALQCPTILDNGFGGHRIEGIGDKHIPWIHNVKNTDMAIAIDDEDSQRLLRLFNTADGKAYMKNELGMSDEEVEKMAWLGISGIANVLCCIKMAKYYELTENDVVGTVLTDSAVMYQSRIDELNQLHGAYNAHEAAMDHARHMLDLKTDSMLELTYTERKRVHNLKYYTWVEQQGMNVEDLNAQWYDTKNTWDAVHAQAKELDELINEFNEATGLLKAL